MYKNCIKKKLNAWRVLFLVPFLLCFSSSYAQDDVSQSERIEKLKSFKVDQPQIYVLKNGLKLVIDVDKRAPVVTHTIWYDVGSADEKEGESGIAHFLEHLMFRGTNLHKAGYFSKRIAEIGGNDNAFTTHDMTAYYQDIPVMHLKEVMALEANRMLNINITQKELLKERDIVLEERSLRVDTNPSAQLFEQMSAALYRNHPYGNPVIGWRHEIAALNKAQVMKFYQKYYAPYKAVVTIVGDVVPETIYQYAQETYGQIKVIPEQEALELDKVQKTHERRQEPPQNVMREITLTHKNVTKNSLYLMLQGVSPVQETKKFYALSMALNYLVGGAHSPVYKKLVKQDKIALSLGGYVTADKKNKSSIVFYLTPAKGVTLKNLKLAFEQELSQMLQKPFPIKDILREKNNLLTNYILAFDKRALRSHLWGKAMIFNQKIEDIIDFPNLITQIQPQDARAILQTLFKPNNQVWGYLNTEKK